MRWRTSSRWFRRLVDTGEFRAAGIGPVSRRRIIMLLGGLRELTAITVEKAVA